MKVNRNAPCPCGSGKKSKRCCGGAPEAAEGKWSKVALYAIAAAVVAGLAFFIADLGQEREATAGRVWSAEHGHWHGPDGTHQGAPLTAPSALPSGTAPAGKVWSAEHGHYH